MDAFEIATGDHANRAMVSAAWYYTKFSDEIFFTQTGVADAASRMARRAGRARVGRRPMTAIRFPSRSPT
jgi:hypothetical protein